MTLFLPLNTMRVCWCFRITGKIGSGHFGNVEKGIWKDSTNKAVVVAVKSLASEENKVKFLQEAVIMGQFSHPNIVNLYGVVTSGVPVSSSVLTCFLSCWSHANMCFRLSLILQVMLILEFISKGDLKKNLTAIRPR